MSWFKTKYYMPEFPTWLILKCTLFLNLELVMKTVGITCFNITFIKKQIYLFKIYNNLSRKNMEF